MYSVNDDDNELAQYLLQRHLEGRRKTDRYAEDDGPPVHEWELAGMEDLDEIPAIGNEHVAEPFRSILDAIQVSTPCSCVDGDTRTCFLHGEVA